MKSKRERITFVSSALLYILFNLKLASTCKEALAATFLHFLQTAPVTIGLTWIIVAFLQYTAKGKKMTWERRFRIFFLIGIITGFLYGIYEYAGVTP